MTLAAWLNTPPAARPPVPSGTARLLPVVGLGPAETAALDRLALGCDRPSHAPALVAAQADHGLVDDAQRTFAWVTSGSGAAAVPAFATDEPLWHLLAGPGALRTSAELLRQLPLRARSIVVGTPLCESGEPLLEGGASLARELPELLAGLALLERQHRALGTFWKDVPAGSELDQRLAAAGFAPFVSLPTARLDLRPFVSLHDWLQWVGEVASAGDLRRKLRDAGLVTPGVHDHLARSLGAAGATHEAARWAERASLLAARLGARGLVLPEGATTPLCIERVHAPSPSLLAALMPLYRARLETAAVSWETLTPRFFAQLVRDPDARLVVARLGDMPVGFSLGLRRGTSWLCLRSGIHPELARPFSVSMLLVLVDLELALAERCTSLLLGPTAYATKARFGAHFGRTVARMRLAPPLRGATAWVAAQVDAANRRAGVDRLHDARPEDDWQPKGRPARRRP